MPKFRGSRLWLPDVSRQIHRRDNYSLHVLFISFPNHLSGLCSKQNAGLMDPWSHPAGFWLTLSRSHTFLEKGTDWFGQYSSIMENSTCWRDTEFCFVASFHALVSSVDSFQQFASFYAQLGLLLHFNFVSFLNCFPYISVLINCFPFISVWAKFNIFWMWTF